MRLLPGSLTAMDIKSVGLPGTVMPPFLWACFGTWVTKAGYRTWEWRMWRSTLAQEALWLGWSEGEGQGSGDLASTLSRLEGLFRVDLVAAAPLVVLFGLAMRRVSALPAIVAGIAAGCLVAIVWQSAMLVRFIGDDASGSFADLVRGIWVVLYAGFTLDSGEPLLDSLLSRGGMASMLNTIRFGALTAAGVSFAFFADIIITPALIGVMQGRLPRMS